jgi:predicted PurR-regulated permease PerM
MNNNSSPEAPDAWPPRRIISATIIVVAIALGFYLLYQFRMVVLSLFAAIVLSTALRPAVDWLQKRGVRRGVGVALILILSLVILVGLILLLLPLITEQVAAVAETLSGYYRSVRSSMVASNNLFLQRVALQLPSEFPPAALEPTAETDLGSDIGMAFGIGGAVLRTILLVAAILLLTFYFVLEGELAIRSLLMFLPAERRENMQLFISNMLDKLGLYTRGLIILSSMVGSMYFVAYLLIGVPQALLLGIIGGIFEIVPIIGPLLGVLPAALIILALDPSRFIWIVIAYAIIQQSESAYFTPRVMKEAAGVNPLITLLALTAFAGLFGVLGAILAIPLAMVVQLVVEEALRSQEESTVEPPMQRSKVSLLRYSAQELIQDVHKQLRQKETPTTAIDDHVEDSIEAITDDLVNILSKVEEEQV